MTTSFTRRLGLNLLRTLAIAAAFGTVTAFAAEEVSVTDIPIQQHSYQIGLGTMLRSMYGGFDAYGNYTANPANSTSTSLMEMMSFSYRLSPKWEVGAGMAFRESRMIFPTGDSASQSVSAPAISARYHLGGWAHAILHAGFSLPWSWRHNQANGDPTASLQDDIGDSAVMPGSSIRLGVGVSQSFHLIRFAFDCSSTIPFAPTTSVQTDGPTGPPVSIMKGPRLQLSEGLSYRLTREWSVNGGLRQAWAGNTYYNGVQGIGTAARAFDTTFGIGYAPNETWHYFASFDTQYPFYQWAVNQPYSPSVGFSLMYSGI